MNKKSNIYVDFHVLQTVPPSCVNRDDTGSPKTAIYGGVTRARVSSQSWKRAMRAEFPGMFLPEQLGKRTKYIVKMVADEIAALDGTLDAEKLAIKALNEA
ncbi:MAG: type I-E CRISPR-associated protein Cas7/Cse4/CasC, partial [Lachnospiraceae bacterium]